jgi:hypothetical protein
VFLLFAVSIQEFSYAIFIVKKWPLYVNFSIPPSRTWKETERNRFLHVLYRNDNYIVFTLKMH